MARALLALFALPACEPPQTDRTEVVVVVDSDLVVGEELDAFFLEVTGPDGTPAREQQVELGSTPGRHALPASFGVAPRGDDPDRVVRIELAAIDEDLEAPEGQRELMRVHRLTTFRAERKLRLDLFLARRCLQPDPPCAPEETCGRDGCMSPVVDPETLPEWE